MYIFNSVQILAYFFTLNISKPTNIFHLQKKVEGRRLMALNMSLIPCYAIAMDQIIIKIQDATYRAGTLHGNNNVFIYNESMHSTRETTSSYIGL